MPDPKTYGYARDLADIDKPGNIPTEVTENAITDFKNDHFQVQDPENPTSDVREINNHEMVTEVTPVSAETQIKAAYEEFDADQRAAVVTASGSVETEESDESDDETVEQ